MPDASCPLTRESLFPFDRQRGLRARTAGSGLSAAEGYPVRACRDESVVVRVAHRSDTLARRESDQALVDVRREAPGEE